MADVLENLPSFVHSHRLFFDKLVELIPSKFYVPNDDAVDTWIFKTKSKEARLAAKKVTRDNLKKAKRNKLDPDKFKSTLQVIQEKADVEALKNADAEAIINVDAAEGDSVPSTKSSTNLDRAVTYDDLRERLHKRIVLLRSKRHAETAAAATESARNFRNEKKKESAKRTIAKAASNHHEFSKKLGNQTQSAKRQRISQNGSQNAAQKTSGAQTELEFSRVKMGVDHARQSHGRKHRKETKESLLKKATELRAKMQDGGEEVVSKHSWTTAVRRAAGDKVLDDPALLKNSIRREKQQKGRSAKKWKERKDTERRAAAEKQKTRKENLAQRVQTKKDRAIAKREKKLMRPGFEGRKAGFINS